jgi:predicted TIM-barrel fold metal-dependent hydrolase
MLPADGPNLLGDPKYDGVYQTAAELNCAIAVHGSGSLMGQSLDTFPKFIQTHTMSHPIFILRQFTSMMFQGAFEKFDSVRFGFMETGGTWVPWWLDRMDEGFEHRGEEEAPVLTQKPSANVLGGAAQRFYGLL